jgi:DNA-binding CsgD family transcriptional regulator
MEPGAFHLPRGRGLLETMGPASAVSEFVGRERELGLLREALAAARARRGGVVLLAGEPGIGKTRTASEFARAAVEEGVDVLWGASYEEEWAPPYGPWIQAAERLVRLLPPDALSERLGDAAPVLAEVVPALGKALPDLRPPPRLAAEEARFRLFDAFRRFFVAGRALVVLDDLHWADRSTLGLLEYVARFVSETSLLVVGTYRDTELGLDHPLTACLAGVDRAGAATRVPLASLSAGQAEELAARLYGGPLDSPVAAAVLRSTEGNPFFIGEVVRHLRERGAAGAREHVIPESVRQAVARRLARLSPETRRMLSVAAAFTRPFTFAVLEPLTGMPEETLLDCVDEALKARMIRAAGGAEEYEFAHVLVRQTLAAEASPSRRARLHRRVAVALERAHAGAEDAYAADLASQYHASRSLPGAAAGIRYACLAAGQAAAASAPEQAVEFLRMALDLAVESDPRTKAEILCELALAQADALAVDAAVATAERAPGDPAFLAELVWKLRAAGAPVETLTAVRDRGLDACAGPRDLSWARLQLVVRPMEPRVSGDLRYGEALPFDPDAVEIARSEGDEQDYARTLDAYDFRTREELETLLDVIRRWTLPPARIDGLSFVVRSFLYWTGGFREAADVCRELLDTAARYGSLPGRAYALVTLAETQMTMGDFEAARATGAEAAELVARLGPGHRLHLILETLRELEVMYVGGDWSWAIERYGPEVERRSLRWGAGQLSLAGVIARARADRREQAEVERLLASLTPALRARGARSPIQSPTVCNCAHAVWELSLVDRAEEYRRLALELIEAGVGENAGHSRELVVARMASLLGDLDQSLDYFERARVMLARSGQRPLRAIADHDEAVVRLRAGVAGASEVLSAARAQFERLGMTVWLERANALATPAPEGLTAREAEVLRLVAAGRSNKQIAAELVLSVHTVERHLANAYAKIGARNRADAAAFAVRHSL